MALIDTQNLYKIYKLGDVEVRALNGVSVSIEKGEFVAVMGPSGSGKSTFMNMIGLLDTPTEGEYYINGKLVDDLTDDEMSVIRNEEIGFIFQGFNLIPSLTALENVELPLVYRGMKKDERRKISIAALVNSKADAVKCVNLIFTRIINLIYISYINKMFHKAAPLRLV